MIGNVVLLDNIINTDPLHDAAIEIAVIAQPAGIDFLVNTYRRKAGRELIAVNYDVIAAVSGQQLDINDLRRVVHVVVDLDAVFGLEFFHGIRRDVVRPVVHIDDVLVTGITV